MSEIIKNIHTNMKKIGEIELSTFFDVINPCDDNKVYPVNEFLEKFFQNNNNKKVSETTIKYLKWSALTKNDILDFFISKGYAERFLRPNMRYTDLFDSLKADPKFTNDCAIMAERFITMFIIDALVFKEIGIMNITDKKFQEIFDKYNKRDFSVDNLKFNHKLNIIGNFFLLYSLSKTNRIHEIFAFISKVAEEIR